MNNPYREPAMPKGETDEVRTIKTNDVKLFFYLKAHPDELAATLEFKDSSQFTYFLMGRFVEQGYVESSRGEDQYQYFLLSSKELGGYKTKGIFIPLDSLYKIEVDIHSYEKKLYGDKKRDIARGY